MVFFLDVFECTQFRDVERNILNDSIIQEHKFRNKLETGHTSNEVVTLSDNFTYKQLVEIVEKHIHSFNFLTPSQLLEKQKLDIIEALINKGETLETINNMFSTPMSEYVPKAPAQEPPKLEMPVATILARDVLRFKPNYGRSIQQIDPNNLKRIVRLYKNMDCLMEDKKYDVFSETGIRVAIKNNTVYKKYRWMIVEPDQNPMIVHDIQPTVESRKGGCVVVLELNIDKTAITRHFIAVSVAAQELQMNPRALQRMISKNTLYNNHYYIYLSDCIPELLDNYDTKVFEYIPKCAIKLKSVHPETKEEQIFPSLKHVRDFCGVHHKTIHKVINERRILNGFYWEYVDKQILIDQVK